MTELIAVSGKLALFSNGVRAVVIDTTLNLAYDVADSKSYELSSPWEATKDHASDGTVAAAELFLTGEQNALLAGAQRMYTIPGGVQAEAKKALEWRKEHKRGGTPVGLNTARTLAAGGQIGIKKISHVAKYFPRHEVDKKAKGYERGEDGFPSNGRIAWALWGGDAAQRWASTIVEREEKKAIAAGGAYGFVDSYQTEYSADEYRSDLNAFKVAHELDPFVGPEFMVRICLSDSGIDRLYKIEIDGQVYVWDGSSWDDMGHVDGDVYSYDKSLDDPSEISVKDYVLVDPASAVVISAFLQERPFQPVRLEEIDPEETRLVSAGLAEEDFDVIDRVMQSAGEPIRAAGTTDSAAPTNQDGNYTPEERSSIANSQPRDAGGKFLSVGARTVVAGDKARGSGEITKINTATGKVTVRLDTGKSIEVDAKYTQGEEDFDGPSVVPGSQMSPPMDFSGILAEPRTPRNSPIAQLPGTLPQMTDSDLELLIRDFPAYVKKMRASYKTYDDSPKGLKAYDKKLVKERHGINAAAAKEEDDSINEPSDSDVPAKYLAIVSPEDHGAVMDVVAIVPDSKSGSTPTLYERRGGEWIENEQILLDLKSVAAPPVVELDDQEVLNDVLTQADETVVTAAAYEFSIFWEKVVEPLLAAGGADRNRGNADALRRYWTKGKGAAKIRWGTPGDWTRCVRNLSKYMGPRAKGYCQLRHKEVTGVYTGSKKNPGRKKGVNASSNLFTSEAEFDSAMLKTAELHAKAADAREKVALVASASRSEQGSSFLIPMLVPEDLESGDGRKFVDGAITLRDLPLPLLWQIKTGAGHDGSVVVGRIDTIERIDGGLGNATGVFDNGPYGREAQRLVENGFLRGVSVDLDKFEAKEEKQPKPELEDGSADEAGDEMGKDKLTINKARIMAATIVAKPAFQECTIVITNSGDQEDYVTPEDGVYEECIDGLCDLEPIMASGYLESEIPMAPPSEWFENPDLKGPTPLTVDKNGRVYGHIAAWNVSHIGLPRSTKPPRSRSKYAYFNTGVVHTAEGTDATVGQLTLAGGHAPLNASAAAAAKHYDDTASAIADVHAGEDQFGIWVAGCLRPDANEMQVRALRASAPSGDWRPIEGSLELVAVCQVNVPGFPTARAMIAGGKMLALVAAGASHMAVLKSEAVQALAHKAVTLGQLALTAPDLKIRVREAKKSLRAANLQSLTASAANMRESALTAAAVAELAKISDDERMELAKKGHAMEDGAYPIRDESDLRNAIQAYGRAKSSERRAVRKHITKRARALKKYDLVPQQWKNANSMEAAERVASMREAITAAANVDCDCELTASASTEFAEGDKDEISDTDLKKLKDAKSESDKQTEEEIKAAEDVKANKGTPSKDEDGDPKYVSGVNQPRDAKGKYRTVLARLKQNLGVAGLAKALKKAEDAENLDFAGDYKASADASGELIGMIDRIDSKALNPEALENVRATAGELGKVISNLPLPFGQDAEKLKFSDLPSGLKDLIGSMITRVEAKIGKKDADIATQSLRSYISGADLYSQGEVQSEMSKLLRLLT